MPKYRKPKAKSRRFTSQHSYDYISSNWAKCTYLNLRVHLQLSHPRRSPLAEAFYGQPTATHTYGGGSFYEWSNLTVTNLCLNEVHLWRRHPTIDALLRPRTSAQAKCTYGEDTLPLKDIWDEKLSPDWRELIAAIHCAAWGAFTVTDRHNSADRLWRL